MPHLKGERDLATVILPKRSEIKTSLKLANLVWRWVNRWLFPLTARSHGLRRGLLRIFGANVGSAVDIARICQIEFPFNLRIGSNSSIGQNAYIQCLDRVEIGENVCISDQSSILTGSHDLSSPTFALCTSPVHLQDQVWVAFGATLLPGVKMGRGSVAGARAVVVQNVSDWTVVAGNPARKISNRELQFDSGEYDSTLLGQNDAR